MSEAKSTAVLTLTSIGGQLNAVVTFDPPTKGAHLEPLSHRIAVAVLRAIATEYQGHDHEITLN